MLCSYFILSSYLFFKPVFSRCYFNTVSFRNRRCIPPSTPALTVCLAREKVKQPLWQGESCIYRDGKIILGRIGCNLLAQPSRLDNASRIVKPSRRKGVQLVLQERESGQAILARGHCGVYSQSTRRDARYRREIALSPTGT